MIPKALDQIEWADLELLKDSGREEGDTIEFKSSFSGGADYLNFTDPQRDKAVKGIAREVIAFLNGRGGDVIIGAEEVSNEDPRIGSFKPMPGVAAIADRLAQSLLAVIEPYQSVVSVRAIRKDSKDEGIVVVRAPQSLRAPHRLTKDNVCYIRRGRESVPMPMDEIQDLNIYREAGRRQLVEDLDRRLKGYPSTLGMPLPEEHIHIAFGLVGQSGSQNSCSVAALKAVDHFYPRLDFGGGPSPMEGPWLNPQPWRPMVRGQFSQYIHQDIREGRRQFRFWQREVHEGGMLIAHIADSGAINDFAGEGDLVIQQDELNEAVASSLAFLRHTCVLLPGLLPAILRVSIRCKGPVALGTQRRAYPFFKGDFSIPDMDLVDLSAFDTAYQLARADYYNLAGQTVPYPCSVAWD
jgi:Putative DNA-binding domain